MAKKGSFWAITSYFNPLGHKRRLANYFVFRKFLQVPLLTVEWDPSDDFQLQKSDADVLIQLSGGDLMWQKERMLNIALENLPSDCETVAWLDCDMIFAGKDWMQKASEELKSTPLVQLFKTLYYTPKSLTPEGVNLESLAEMDPILTGNSLAFQLLQKTQEVEAIEKKFNGQIDSLAWAASKETMLEHGFYDARIVGGGGMALLKAAWGNYSEYIEERSLNAAQTKHYIDWAVPFSNSINGKIGFIDEVAYHLWHGELSNRRYRVRQQKLNEYDFDPTKDIAVSESGCWSWNSDKPLLHQYLVDYFNNRNEDNV